MTKVLKMLGGGGLAAVLGVVLLGLSGALNASTVSAESPPNPPSRIVGSVKVDGVNAPAGTTVEARIGNASCGVTTVFTANNESRYAVDVPALDPGATPNCGTDGAVISFFVGGRKANETGTWANYQLGTVNLTVTTQATATASPSASPGASPSASAAVPSATVRPPATGNTADGAGESAAIWLFALVGMGALAFGVGGATIARRGR